MVTNQRRPTLVGSAASKALRMAFLKVRESHHFRIDAISLPPDWGGEPVASELVGMEVGE
jgi:REP element-mobilizing transposase RayT